MGSKDVRGRYESRLNVAPDTKDGILASLCNKHGLNLQMDCICDPKANDDLTLRRLATRQIPESTPLPLGIAGISSSHREIRIPETWELLVSCSAEGLVEAFFKQYWHIVHYVRLSALSTTETETEIARLKGVVQYLKDYISGADYAYMLETVESNSEPHPSVQEKYGAILESFPIVLEELAGRRTGLQLHRDEDSRSGGPIPMFGPRTELCIDLLSIPNLPAGISLGIRDLLELVCAPAITAEGTFPVYLDYSRAFPLQQLLALRKERKHNSRVFLTHKDVAELLLVSGVESAQGSETLGQAIDRVTRNVVGEAWKGVSLDHLFT